MITDTYGRHAIGSIENIIGPVCFGREYGTWLHLCNWWNHIGSLDTLGLNGSSEFSVNQTGLLQFVINTYKAYRMKS